MHLKTLPFESSLLQLPNPLQTAVASVASLTVADSESKIQGKSWKKNFFFFLFFLSQRLV